MWLLRNQLIILFCIDNSPTCIDISTLFAGISNLVITYRWTVKNFIRFFFKLSFYLVQPWPSCDTMNIYLSRREIFEFPFRTWNRRLILELWDYVDRICFILVQNVLNDFLIIINAKRQLHAPMIHRKVENLLNCEYVYFF